MLKEFLQNKSEKNNIKKQIYQYIHSHKRTSKIEMLQAFNLPQTTLTRMIYELQDKGFIYNDGKGEPTGGRPPVYYAVVQHAGYVVGIDISRTHLTAILTNLLFVQVDRVQIKLNVKYTPELIVQELIVLLKQLVNKHKLAKESLLGIGIGAVGPLDREQGVILNPDCFLANEWRNVPIVKMLQKEFSVPITLNNGANTAAFAEYYVNSLQNDSILYCINGYSVRTGFLEGGVIGTNQTGDSTAAGHIIIDINGKPCKCGKKGCLSTYTTYGAIMNQIIEKKGLSTTISDGIDELAYIFQALSKKDQVVEEVVLQSAEYYGIGISNMINILHPTKVFLHGKLIYQFPNYYDKVVKTIRHNIYNKENISIRKSSLGEESVALGGAIEVFHTFFSN